MAARRRRSVGTNAPRSYSSPACYLHEFRPAPKGGHRPDIQIKRIYDASDAADGFRALVDRLWPRGISRQRAALDDWLLISLRVRSCAGGSTETTRAGRSSPSAIAPNCAHKPPRCGHCGNAPRDSA